ncbi:RNA-binding protein 25 [Diachasma alloeum]|uniref:RNA-binding protein 25 n=1 Tax=Diachasma alloeum TaxID=454923 RepID=UPI0007382B09|nr:RNA-binding protein 25 [Diachasma alloeum]
MSYPGQPPMGIPGMPPMPYMVGAPPPIIGGVMPMPHMIPTPVSAMQTSAPAVRYSRNQPRHDPTRRRERETGPPVTVFVGNIMDRAPDVMIRHILGACGHVLSWKRVQAFGFCEYAGPDAGLRAIRLLHDMEIGNKKLVVKVDAKAKVVLDQFKAERRKKLKGGQSPLQDETPNEAGDGDDADDYMDEGMRVVDSDALTRISQILSEHSNELELAQNAPDARKATAEEHQAKLAAKSLNLDDAEIEESKRDLITREIGKFREVMKKQEEEKAQVKRKKEAVEKEEREKREKKRRDRRDDDVGSKDEQEVDLGSPLSHKGHPDRRDKRRSKSRSKERERERDRVRDRMRRDRREDDIVNKDDQDVDLGSPMSHKGHPDRRDKRRSKSRSKERDRMRDRNRERDREREEVRKSEREIMREREEEEEAKERKKNERRAREKEAAYQERLRAWETRERRKQKEYEKESEKKRGKREAREKEAKRLKEFLEDYDDDRDDAKYYKGKELARRLEERALEAEADSRDRCAERQELQRLRDKLYADASHPDPAAEFERLKAEREEQYKPKPVITIIDEEDEKIDDRKPIDKDKEERERMPPIETEPIDSDSDDGVEFEDPPQEPSRTPPRHHYRHRRHHRQPSYHRDFNQVDGIMESEKEPHNPNHKRNSVTSLSNAGGSVASVTSPAPVTPSQIGVPSQDDDSRMSLVSEPEKMNSGSNFVPFAMGANRSSDHGIGNKTPASPGGNNQQVNQSGQARKKTRMDVKDVFNNDDEDDGSSNSKKRKLVPLDYGDEKKKKGIEEVNANKGGKEESTKSQEEKRKHIKSLIDKIPTDKNALFAYQLDWAVIDNALMEKRIRPWINKKIIEYIGEPEPTLVDFICSKVMAGSSPQGILDDVQMVLDEEAEVFVVKMWRLLIYEVEAKKMGLVK